MVPYDGLLKIMLLIILITNNQSEKIARFYFVCLFVYKYALFVTICSKLLGQNPRNREIHFPGVFVH